MLGVDEHKLASWRRMEVYERTAELRRQQLAKELESHEVTVADDAGYDVTSLEAQIGRPMTCEQVMDKLRKCNSSLYFERSKSDPRLMGIYLVDPTAKPYINPEGKVLNIRHIMGMEAGIMPEMTVIHTTKTRVANPDVVGNKAAGRDVPWKVVDTYLDRTMGWRSVLVRLLHARLITEYDVRRHFGWTPSRTSEKWKTQTT